MKNKIWMTVLALFCLGIGLLSGGCAAPQASQRYEQRPLIGGGGAPEIPGERSSDWQHPAVMP
jgi:hypothetical protein